MCYLSIEIYNVGKFEEVQYLFNLTKSLFPGLLGGHDGIIMLVPRAKGLCFNPH